MAVTVSVIFAVCWLADSTVLVLDYYAHSHTIGETVHAATSIMIMFNSAINPIMYALVNQKFRKKLKGMMCCACRPAKRIYAERESYRMEGVQSINNPTQTIG